MQKGESLDAWATHVRPSFIVIWQVLADILLRLSAMHACGWVHRDLKPGNVLWRPHEHQWTLIDFGCAAETGAPPTATAWKPRPSQPARHCVEATALQLVQHLLRAPG